MKSLFNQPRPSVRSLGFTLVELLVAMAVIGILVGMLSVGVQRVLVRAREFTIQNEVNQLQSSIEQFNTQFGFYPPSFKGMEDAAFLADPSGSQTLPWSVDARQAAGDWMLSFLSRIAPNHTEGAVIPDGSGGSINLNPDFSGERFVDRWVRDIGSKRLNRNPGSNLVGSDLVFWMSGIAKNKQRPLTQTGDLDGDGNLEVLPNLAHNKGVGDTTEREVFYEFDDNQIVPIPDPENPGFPAPWVAFVQPVGNEIPYLYLDRNHYLPSARYAANPGSLPNDGAYCRANLDFQNYNVPGIGTVNLYEVLRESGWYNDQDRMQPGSTEFELLYPNRDSFQLISFGIDGLPGEVDPQGEWSGQNVYQVAGPASADNMINFSSGGAPGRLDTLIFEEQ